MAKRKKSIFYYLGQIFVYLYKLIKYVTVGIVKIIYYGLKGIVYCVEFIIKKVSSKNDNGAKIKDKSENKINEGLKKEPNISTGKFKSEPIYEQFKEIKNLKNNFVNFEEKILTSNSTIGIILGARGTGKSAIGMKLLENFKVKTGKNVYAMGFNAKDLPNWINVVEDINDIENNSVVLVDESGIQFSSRDSMSNRNKLLSRFLLIARHKDLSLIFISQSSANIEINAIRQSDYIILKPSSLLQKDFERKKIKEIYEEVEKDFEKLKDVQGITYIYAHDYKGFISNKLPSFWNNNVSKSYK